MCDTNDPPCSMIDEYEFSEIGPTDLKEHTGDCNHNTVPKASAERTFYDKCVEWRDTLELESAAHGNSHYNKLEMIGHIGFFVSKYNSCHCIGKAFDLTKVKWNGVDSEPCDGDHASPFRTQRRRYLAVDASLRKHFKWVLDGWYDALHANHIHASAHYPLQSTIVLDKNSQSDTVFVQAVCNNFNGANLVIDGIWGPATGAAFNDINLDWDFSVAACDPFTSHDAYVDWLHRVMIAGFADISASLVSLNDGCNFPPRGGRSGSRSGHR
jgi:hypothetical protein